MRGAGILDYRPNWALCRSLGLLYMPVEVVHGALQRALFQPQPEVLRPLNAVLAQVTGRHLLGVHFRTTGPAHWKDPPRLNREAQTCHLYCMVMLFKWLNQGVPRGTAPEAQV